MRIRWRHWMLGVWIGLFCMSQTAWANSDNRRFLDGVSAYKTGDYKGAVTAFKALTDEGIVNAKLYYNLGNAYFKAEDLGHAILWYERALRLDSDDPDLLFNLDYARSLTKDEDTSKGISLYRILFFWKYKLSHRTILGLAMASNALFWILLLLRGFVASKRRSLGAAAMVVALPALIFVLTAFYNYYETSHGPNAVILPESVSVRSGLSDHATELFVLHAGTVVKIQRHEGDFLRIAYSKDKIGWIRNSQAGVI